MDLTPLLQRTARLPGPDLTGSRKIFLAMKLTTLLLFSFCLQLNARSYAQGLTLSVKKASLESIIYEIQKQSPYRFVYTSEELKESNKISISVRGASIETVLGLCFKDQPLAYIMEEKFIIIRKKEKPTETKTPISPGIDVSGKVVNERGEGIPAATIGIKGKPIGTTTNEKGMFELKDIEPSATLQVSCVGYEFRQVLLRGNTQIVIQLKIAVSSLDELLIKGYYNTTRRLNTGSVSKVSAEDIAKQPVTNPLAALEGRVTGLFIIQGTGLPGTNFSVQIRGRNSIQSGNSPLYIIDGVPFLSDADRLTQRSSINANSPFNSINPGDIESIEVLKDADATAIYGSRGANGVILITTRKGKAGKTRVELTMSSGWEKITRSMPFMNTPQYLQMRREAFKNDGVTPNMSNAPDLLAWDTARYTDWQKLLIGGTGYITQAQLRLSGGTEATRFTLGANYSRQSTVFPGTNNDQRTGVQLGLQHYSLDKKFQLQFSGSYSADKSGLIPQDLTELTNLPPNAPLLYDANGKLNWQEKGQAFSFTNPLAVLLKTYDGITNRLTANSVLSYNILPKLTVRTSLGFNQIGFEEKLLTPLSSQNPDDNPYASASFGNKNFTSWIIEPQAEYKTGIGKYSKLEILLGSSWQKNTTKSTIIDAGGYTNDALISSIGGAPNVRSSNDFNQYKYNAVFARLGYQWKSKYLLNLTARKDGSSRFGSRQRWANFGAIGAGWIFSDEAFFRSSGNWLSFGKLRASVGVTGNDQIGDYQYLDTWTQTQYPYSNQPSLYPSRLYNPDFSWERNKKGEVALELGLLHDRVHLVLNWYMNRSDNQLINFSLPAQTGFTTITRNFPGIVQNTGWEAELNTTMIKKQHFAWNAAFNMSIPRNKLIAFPGLEKSSYAHTYAIGYPLGNFIGFHFLGVDPLTGRYVVEDRNKDGKFDEKDYINAGNTNPVYYGGLLNSLKYKGWQLDILFQFTLQQGVHPIYGSYFPLGAGQNQPAIGIERWQKPGDKTTYEQFSQSFGNPATPAAFLTASSDAVLTDASFIRLKNAQLSYQLQERLLKKLRLEILRLFIQGQNLLTWTSYAGADPENQTLLRLPPLKTVAIGLSVTF